MKIYATLAVRPVSTGAIRQPRTVEWKIACRPGPLVRFRRFIETTEWEETLLGSRWIETACAAVLIASCCFFLPLLAAVIIRMNP